MAKATKPVCLLESSRLTKEEIQARQEQEDKLKGNNTLVYDIPEYLTEEEKLVYKFLVDELKESNILNNLDIEILTIASNTIVSLHKERKLLRNEGSVVTKVNGDVTKNPRFSIVKELEKTFQWVCRELALSPSTRASLSLINANAMQQEQDPLLRVLRGEDI